MPVATRLAGRFTKTVGLTPKSFAGQVGFFGAVNMYADQDSLGKSLAKGAADTLLFQAFKGPYIAYMLGSATYAGVKASVGVADRHAREWNSRHFNNTLGGNYTDTQHAFNMRQAGLQAIQQSNQYYGGALTQRQAAVQAIAGSKLNARSAIGGEARLMHIPY